MPTIGQIQGMLLEEAILHLLRFSGYSTVDSMGTDPCLNDGRAGLEVRGRGELHQIDAVADFLIPQPFGYPSRLLVEAKFKTKRVGMDVVRNVVGVHKDVSEFFAPDPAIPAARRYHYQVAVASSTGFTKNAQRYAFAQDVDLIPLDSSSFFQPVTDAINSVAFEFPQDAAFYPTLNLRSQRLQVRQALRYEDARELDPRFEPVVRAASTRFGFLAVAGRRQRLFLVAAPGLQLEELKDSTLVELYLDGRNWLIKSGERPLFSFEVPLEVYRLYSSAGRTHPGRALNLKADLFQEILIYVSDGAGTLRIVRLNLNTDWFESAVARRLIEAV